MLRGAPKAPLPWDILVFVTITTVGFGFSVQQLMHTNPAGFVTAGQYVNAPPVREPQSSSKNPDEVISANTAVDLGCIERQLRHQRIHTEDSAIRVKGKFCDLTTRAMRDFGGVSVRNLTTGYEGTIFFQGAENGFITDYMVVQGGKNIIRVEWKASNDFPAQALTAEVYSH